MRDRIWIKIKEALLDKKYELRTLDGICKETGLSKKIVHDELTDHVKEIKAYPEFERGVVAYRLKARGFNLRLFLYEIQIHAGHLWERWYRETE